MLFHPGLLAYALLLPIAAAAGFVDSIAGGGGIITLPALLAAGLPPHLALGTNKLQSSFGSLAATLRYRAAGLVDLREMAPGIAATAIGAAAGAAAVGAIDASFLKVFIPALLLCIVALLALNPRFGADASARRIPRLPFWIGSGLVFGFYDGFFGPGTGTFWTIALVALAGFEMRGAAARTKVANFTSNIVSLGVFLSAGSVLFPLGVAMGAAQACGALLGSRMVVRRGAPFVRGILMLMSGGIVAYVIIKYWVLV